MVTSMDSDKRPEQPAAPAAAAGAAVSAGRRRLLRGGLSAAPVLATFVSQPVHATYTCKSASAFTSANASRPAVTPCNGCGPTWWKTNTGSWVGCATGTTFATYFTVTAAYPTGTTLLQVLNGVSTADSDKMARNLVAALLNIKSGRIGAGVFTEAQLKTIWTSALTTGYVPTAGATPWNAAGVNTWLGTVFSTT